ncbi:hypothetical protein Hanom_Chr13g01193231 [Helianthus anomalus]
MLLWKKLEDLQKMLNDRSKRPTPANWKKAKQVDLNEALKVKRMRAELVAADYGSARSIGRWSKCNVVEAYKKLEELRAKDPNVPQKTVNPTTTAGRPQQTQTSKKLLSTSALSENALKQLKRQKQLMRKLSRGLKNTIKRQ